MYIAIYKVLFIYLLQDVHIGPSGHGSGGCHTHVGAHYAPCKFISNTIKV